MRILIIHQNFPGQFRHLARAWSGLPGWEVMGLGHETAPGMTEVPWLKYSLHRRPRENQHHYLRQMERAVLHGQAVARALLKLRKRGFRPDVILAHPAWGETLYAKDVFPDSRLIHYCEWYYAGNRADLGFDPEFPCTFDDRARVRTWNALCTLNLGNCDAGVSPTQWQKSRHPDAYQNKIEVIHEGIDTDNLGPDPNATFTTPSGTILKAGDPVITYVARSLEPYRGFHSFMRALEIIQQKHKTCHALIVGGDGVSYGRRPKDAPNWREKMLGEVKVDPNRTHFLGRIPYETYRRVLQVSAAHVYLTYPFVLSWSMLEAMATGCLVIGSRTPPVEEVLTDGENGLMVDFFDKASIAQIVIDALESPEAYGSLKEQAKGNVAKRFSRREGLERYQNLVLQSCGLQLVTAKNAPGEDASKAPRGAVEKSGIQNEILETEKKCCNAWPRVNKVVTQWICGPSICIIELRLECKSMALEIAHIRRLTEGSVFLCSKYCQFWSH